MPLRGQLTVYLKDNADAQDVAQLRVVLETGKQGLPENRLPLDRLPPQLPFPERRALSKPMDCVDHDIPHSCDLLLGGRSP
jgi:hypothetical protein